MQSKFKMFSSRVARFQIKNKTEAKAVLLTVHKLIPIESIKKIFLNHCIEV